MWGETVGVGVVYGFANFILLLAYAVTFRFAAYLLTLPVDHTLYANFDEVFTVFLAVILGSLAAGQASAALPLATQATSAAGRILGVMAPQVADEEAGNAEGDGRSLVRSFLQKCGGRLHLHCCSPGECESCQAGGSLLLFPG